MIDNPQTGVASIGGHLLVGATVAWRIAERECDRTIRAWLEAPCEQATTAYLAYRAALDREEAAAHDLERLWQLYEPYAYTIVVASQGVAK